MGQQAITEESVLNTITHLLTNEGEDKFTMDRLAEETGLSRATLYRRFGSREALLQRVVQERGITVAELDRPDVHTRILQAARVVFGQVGVVKATIEQIAQEANVGQATVYRHFSSKEGLAEAFAQSFSPRQFIRDLSLQKGTSLEEGLSTFATNSLSFLYENKDLIRLVLTEGEEAQQLLGRVKDNSNRTIYNLAQFFEAQIKAGNLAEQNPQDLAFAFMGLIFSFTTLAPNLYNRPLEKPEEMGRFITDIFLHGTKNSRGGKTAGEQGGKGAGEGKPQGSGGARGQGRNP